MINTNEELTKIYSHVQLFNFGVSFASAMNYYRDSYPIEHHPELDYLLNLFSSPNNSISEQLFYLKKIAVTNNCDIFKHTYIYNGYGGGGIYKLTELEAIEAYNKIQNSHVYYGAKVLALTFFDFALDKNTHPTLKMRFLDSVLDLYDNIVARGEL